MTYASRTGAFTILRGESPGGVMDFTVDTATDPKVLKVRERERLHGAAGRRSGPDQLALAPGRRRSPAAAITVQWNDTQHRHARDDDVVDRPRRAAEHGTNEVLADLLIPYDATAERADRRRRRRCTPGDRRRCPTAPAAPAR